MLGCGYPGDTYNLLYKVKSTECVEESLKLSDDMPMASLAKPENIGSFKLSESTNSGVETEVMHSNVKDILSILEESLKLSRPTVVQERLWTMYHSSTIFHHFSHPQDLGPCNHLMLSLSRGK